MGKGTDNMQKTITCKIHDLTKVKERILQSEYDEYQQICREVQEWINNDYPDTQKPYRLFKTPTRYSATVWGAIRSTTKRFTNLNEQPLYLRNDVFKITENPNKISKHWFSQPKPSMVASGSQSIYLKSTRHCYR